MRMSEDQARTMSAQARGELGNAFIRELQRVEVHRTIEQPVAGAATPAEVAIFGVAPDLRHALPQPPAGPFIGTQRAGVLPLFRGFVDADRQRHARRTRGALHQQFRRVELRRQKLAFAGPQVSLRHDREVPQIVERFHVVRVNIGRIPRLPVERHMVVRMEQNALERIELPRANRLGGIELRFAEFAQVS